MSPLPEKYAWPLFGAKPLDDVTNKPVEAKKFKKIQKKIFRLFFQIESFWFEKNEKKILTPLWGRPTSDLENFSEF